MTHFRKEVMNINLSTRRVFIS